MKILFFGAKSYDIKSFDAYLDKEEYKDLDVVYIEPNLTPQTAMLAAGYEAVCAFVNMDLSAETIDILNTCKVKLILMRCAGFNNVDLERAKGYGMTVTRVPSYSPEAVAEHAMALALTANRHTHKAYIQLQSERTDGCQPLQKDRRYRRNRKNRCCDGTYLPRIWYESDRLRYVPEQRSGFRRIC